MPTSTRIPPPHSAAIPPQSRQKIRGSGGEGDRTPDLVNAIHALSQLSYAPVIYRPPSEWATVAPRQHGNVAVGRASVKRFTYIVRHAEEEARRRGTPA